MHIHQQSYIWIIYMPMKGLKINIKIDDEPEKTILGSITNMLYQLDDEIEDLAYLVYFGISRDEIINKLEKIRESIWSEKDE